jgi:nucleotidyltransferase/DNA polymerase involved in DNA repair
MSESAVRCVLHLDMDAFYAAVEQRDRPELLGKPVVVGADPRGGRGRGVVSTASYEARRFGVHSALPISRAFELCPLAVFLPVDMEKYEAVSQEVMGLLREVTDRVEPLSIDEAFLDVTGSRLLFGDGETIARRLKAAIREKTRLTASVGVATNKLVAKIASEMRKPDGLVVVPPGGEAGFLAPLPVRRLWGVGPKLEEKLLLAGIHRIGDLAALAEGRLLGRVGVHGLELRRLALGQDDREVPRHSAGAKSIGHEHTFDEDTRDIERLRRTLLDLSDSVGRRLRRAGATARRVTLKYRDESFRTATRAETLAEPTDSGDALFCVAWRLFEGVHGGLPVRLVGVSASSLDRGPQLDLFPQETRPVDRVRDAIADRFGKEAVTRASLLGRRERRHPEAARPDPAEPGTGEPGQYNRRTRR